MGNIFNVNTFLQNLYLIFLYSTVTLTNTHHLGDLVIIEVFGIFSIVLTLFLLAIIKTMTLMTGVIIIIVRISNPIIRSIVTVAIVIVDD